MPQEHGLRQFPSPRLAGLCGPHGAHILLRYRCGLCHLGHRGYRGKVPGAPDSCTGRLVHLLLAVPQLHPGSDAADTCGVSPLLLEWTACGLPRSGLESAVGPELVSPVIVRLFMSEESSPSEARPQVRPGTYFVREATKGVLGLASIMRVSGSRACVLSYS